MNEPITKLADLSDEEWDIIQSSIKDEKLEREMLLLIIDLKAHKNLPVTLRELDSVLRTLVKGDHPAWNVIIPEINRILEEKSPYEIRKFLYRKNRRSMATEYVQFQKRV